MGIFAKWRDNFAPIRFLVNAQKTPWYPVLFAVLCIIGGTHDHTVYIPILWILSAFVLFSVFFTDDNKVFLTPLLMIFFSLGCDTSSDAFSDSNGEMLAFMDKGAFVQVMTICVICVGSFIVRLILDGSIALAFKRRRLFTVSIIAMDIAFLANGLFSPGYEIVNLGYGAFLAMGFTVVYFIVSGMLEHSEDPITYACYAMVATAYVVFLQISQVAIKLHLSGSYIIKFWGVKQLNKDGLTLGWGISTVIGAVMVLGIPAAMYLAKNKKGSLFFFISSILFVGGTVIVGARSAMLVGTLTFLFCTLACCIKGKNRVLIRIYSLSSVAIAIAALILIDRHLVSLSEFIDKAVGVLRLDLNKDSGRRTLWTDGINDFRSSPIFGTGFNDGGYPENLKKNNFFSNMYHCILVQLPGSMGLVGCIAFAMHAVSLCIACFKKISLDKILLIFIPLSILGMSLVDNFFFYLHFQIFYGTFIAIAEKYDTLPSTT